MAKKTVKSSKNDNQYQAKDIYVLEGLEPVRRRPGMYIGSTGVDGLHHLIWEVVDNSIDEAMAGFCDRIDISLMPNHRVVVMDNGRGIPVDIHPQTKKSALETVLTTLHAGGKFGGESYKVSGGLHGVGVSVVNALSQYAKAEVCKDGGMYVQEYERGRAKVKVKKTGSCKQNGTTITFEPDPQIFSPPRLGETGKGDTKIEMPDYDLNKILSHLRQQAYLTRGVKINIIDLRNYSNDVKNFKNPEDQISNPSSLVPSYAFYFEGGIIPYIQYLNRDQKPRHNNIFYVGKEMEEIFVETAFQYSEDISSKEVTFANNIHTIEGGMHLTGFRAALTRSLNDYARKNGYLKNSDENLSGDDIREGLTVVVSIKLREPQFEGQTKAKLGNPEARTAVEAIVNDGLEEFLEKNPSDARSILEKCLLSQKARQAARAARDTILRKGVLDGMTLPGKLADCSSSDPSKSELFIVEGDSAGGSAKQGRDRNFQAILPLRGKILNIEKARLDKALASKEVKSLIIALGTAIAEEFDINKLRYHRIVIMTDADVDGAHIRTLLLTLFFRYLKPIIEAGYLYIAQPPLYRIAKGKEAQYAYSDQDKAEIIQSFKKDMTEKKKTVVKVKQKSDDLGEPEEESQEEIEGAEGVKGINIQRYKGLGEMNPDQLWETTMNPQNRVLKQVNISDAEEADSVFDVLMGDEVAPRKRFIQTHAKKVKNLDI